MAAQQRVQHEKRHVASAVGLVDSTEVHCKRQPPNARRCDGIKHSERVIACAVTLRIDIEPRQAMIGAHGVLKRQRAVLIKHACARLDVTHSSTSTVSIARASHTAL